MTRHALLVALVALPPACVAAWAISGAETSAAMTALVSALCLSVALVVALEARAARRLKTMSAVLEAYRAGDFALRAKVSALDGPAHDVLVELNALGDALRTHRLGEMEAWTLLRKVMSEVDVVVLAVGEHGRIRLANEAAARMLGKPVRDLLESQATKLGLDELLGGEVPRIVKLPASAGPWELRRGAFRLEGVSQTLIVLSDVSRALRDNERDAWRRLIRVMGHEINNSLSPIKSISESLLALAHADPRPADWESDLEDGLGVVARRAEALARFMASYATLARLPPPRRAPIDLATLVEKVVLLEKRTRVEIVGGPTATIRADTDQLEQALINLLKNAADASLAGGGAGVRIAWAVGSGDVRLTIEDDGPGVGDTANLFVPFFTTKPGGSGIGLALSRQIVEGHDGELSLATRTDGKGAVALVRLPA